MAKPFMDIVQNQVGQNSSQFTCYL